MPTVVIRLGRVVEPARYHPELAVEDRARVDSEAMDLNLVSGEWVRFAIELALANPGAVRRAMESERASIRWRDITFGRENSRPAKNAGSVVDMSEELTPNYRVKETPFSATQFRPNIMPWPKGVRAAGEDGYFIALSGPGTVHPITAGDWVVVNLSSGHMSLYGDSEWKRMLEEKVFEPFTPS